MPVPTENLLFIGELASHSGIPIKTIRYYEDIGLVKPSSRTVGKFRQFSPNVLARLGFIKRAQNLGLSLQEIGEILDVYDQGNVPCDEIKEKLKAKLWQIDQKIKQLKMLKAELERLLSS